MPSAQNARSGREPRPSNPRTMRYPLPGSQPRRQRWAIHRYPVRAVAAAAAGAVAVALGVQGALNRCVEREAPAGLGWARLAGKRIEVLAGDRARKPALHLQPAFTLLRQIGGTASVSRRRQQKRKRRRRRRRRRRPLRPVDRARREARCVRSGVGEGARLQCRISTSSGVGWAARCNG